MKATHTLRVSLPLLLAAAGAASVVVVAWQGVALADPNNPSDSDKAAARPFAIEGLEKVKAGNCREAVGPLEKAEALVHAPTTAVPLAQCDIQLGRLVEGTEILNRVLNETLPPNAPPSFTEAKREARGILDAATPRIPKLKIHVDAPGGVQQNLELTVDGQKVPLVLLDSDRPTDPGPHHVAARQPGGGSAEADVTLAEGQTVPVSLHLTGAGGAVAPVTGGVPDPYGQGVVAPPPPAGGGATADSGASWMAFEFGARLAFGLPLGFAQGGNGNDLNQSVSNQFVPLWLDAGIRFLSNWYVGAYLAYGITSLTSSIFGGQCSQPGFGCSANDIRFGIDAAYHIIPDGKVDPWVGLGFGFEWLSLSETLDAAHSGSGAAITHNNGVSGWEFVNVQAGVDFRLLNGALGLGPFILLALDQYSHASAASDNNGATVGQDIQNQALHEWVLFGAKGDYDLKF